MSYNFTDENLNNPWFPSSTRRSGVSRAGRGLSSAIRSGASGWSSAQIFIAVTVGLVAISAGLAGYAGLIVSSITTFNLNNYYYGRIGELGDAVLNPSSPLFVNTTTDPAVVYLTCSGSQSNLCSYVAYLNASIFALQNATVQNVTLSSLSYTNGATFMTNVTTGKGALDNLVGEALYLQSQINNLATANGTVTLSTLTYTNGASFMTNVTTGKGALDNLVGEAIVQAGQITTLQGQTAQLLATKNRNYYVSASYGNDATCDGSASLPCLTLYRTLQLIPNTTNQFAQNTIVFDNGLYVESNFIAFKPNIILSGNEIGTLLIFSAGAGLDGGAWIATGTGYVTVLRMGAFSCVSACVFDMATDAPATSIFSVFRFYNTSVFLNSASMSFRRRNDASSYFGVTMESTTVVGPSITFQDMTYLGWDLTGDCYSTISVNYNASSTYSGGVPIINFNGIVSHNNIVVNNYVSGLLVDWSLMDLILRDSATLTRNYVSGASINVHGDVLSLGSINGGLLSTGVGSGTTQYLTSDYGLGTAQDTPANWDLPYPVNQHETNTQLASRLTTLESGLSWFRLNRATYTNGTISPAITIPASVFEVMFIVIGAGGGGSAGLPGITPGCGGGAGAKTLVRIPVKAGDTFNGYIGAGGIGSTTDGEASDVCITSNSNTECYYAGGGGVAQTGVSQCIPGSGGSNNPTTGSAIFNVPGTADPDTNAYAGATAGVAGCTSPGVNGKTTGDFSSGASGGCALNQGGRTYGGVPPLPLASGHGAFGGGDGAAGWAGAPGQGGPDLALVSCNGGNAEDGGGGGGGGAILLGLGACVTSTGGNGGNGLVYYRFNYY